MIASKLVLGGASRTGFGIRGYRRSFYKNKTKASTFTNDPIFTNVKFVFTLEKLVDPT